MFCLVYSAVAAQAQVGLDFDIHTGNHPARQSPPIFVEPPPIVVESPPEMVFVEGLGIYVAVGLANDLFFSNNVYYYHNNGAWYRSNYYRGPWTHTDFQRIPPGLRRHRIEKMREFRERSWRDYREHPDHFKGRHFR